ncbi:MAG: DUF4339 domain-containing protein [Opitutaceae bacterium]|jgi:hypothetical protein
MATKEFYIRNPDETEARGPFSVEQLTSLVEAGQVTADTLFYEASTEQWIAIKDNAEVKELTFPEKKKLTIKKNVPAPVQNAQSSDSRPAISVHDFLAAAEGRTDDTKDKSHDLMMADRCAKFGLWGCILTLLLAAAGEILPSIDVLTQFSAPKLIANPLVVLGALDVALSVLLILGVVTIYPLVRFRAMLGLGFLGFIYFTQGQPMLLAATVAGSVGLYICTVFLSYVPIGLGLLLGLGGMGALGYLLIL